MDPLVLEMAQKVARLVDNIQNHVSICSPKAFVEQPAVTNECKPGIHGCLRYLRKPPQEKQTGKLLVTLQAHMDYLIMCLNMVMLKPQEITIKKLDPIYCIYYLHITVQVQLTGLPIILY